MSYLSETQEDYTEVIFRAARIKLYGKSLEEVIETPSDAIYVAMKSVEKSDEEMAKFLNLKEEKYNQEIKKISRDSVFSKLKAKIKEQKSEINTLTKTIEKIKSAMNRILGLDEYD